MLERNRRGDDDKGDESTRTRWADGVLGGTSIEFSNNL
jgi:hypothetical protein